MLSEHSKHSILDLFRIGFEDFISISQSCFQFPILFISIYFDEQSSEVQQTARRVVTKGIVVFPKLLLYRIQFPMRG